MEMATWKGYPLSRLMLGTVQFGMPYGVANRTGQPGYKDVLAMVAAAVEGGVNSFDTAASYGTSEAVLGRALHELGMADRVVVVTKVRALTPEEAVEDALAAKVIEQSVLESRRRLQMDCLPVVLFHNESDARHLDVLERLKTKGLVRQVGVSCNDPSGTVAGFIANPAVSALQLPCNVLDRRHQHRGVFGDAAAHEVAIFIRSVYLQGLLVMAEDRIPGPLEGVIPVRRRLAELAGEAGMTLAELALRYMLSQSGVTCILVGVETDAQVRENVAMFSRGPLANDLIATIDAAVPVLPEPILTPRLWPTLPLKG